MFNLLQHRKPSKKEAVISILIVFFILGFPMIAIRDMVPHIPILLALICLIVYGRARGISFDKMQDSMAESVHTSMGAIYLFFLYRYIGYCSYDIWCHTQSYLLWPGYYFI